MFLLILYFYQTYRHFDCLLGQIKAIATCTASLTAEELAGNVKRVYFLTISLFMWSMAVFSSLAQLEQPVVNTSAHVYLE